VKRAALICIAALTSCTTQHEAGCPAIEKLAHRDAAADARAALAKGGFVGSVPGVDDPAAYRTQIMEGTSDVRTEACAHQRNMAEAYAAKYNQTIAQGTGG
jgi:hypothetical protein